MMSEKEIQSLVKQWVGRCTEFLENDERGFLRKQISTPNQVEMNSYRGEKCPTCAEKMTRSRKHQLTVEHIIPRCLGGNNTRANLVAMCHHCNQYRNAVMIVFLPHLPTIRGIKLAGAVKENLSRFIEWALRTIHTPKSKMIDTELSQLFAEYSAPIENGKKTIKKAKQKAKQKAKLKDTKNPKNQQAIASDDILEVLKEILETQRAILERLQKSPLRRLRDWVAGFFTKKKPHQHIERKSKTRRSRKRRDSKNEGKSAPKPSHKYFCPTCDTLFKTWKLAKIHKKETGHGCRVCDDCGKYFAQERFRLAHEEDTGHTNFSGNFFGQKRMSIKHYLPEDRLVTIGTLRGNEIDVEGFSKIIEELIGEGEVTGVELGNRVRRYQKENDWPTLGTRAFLGAFGIPKGRGLAKAIFSVMGDRVTVTGDNHITRKIRLNSKQKTQEKEPEPEPELSPTTSKKSKIKKEGEVFPIVDGLNSSTKGFRLPRNPRQLAETLIWFENNHQLYATTAEIKLAMTVETELTRTRINYLITKLMKIVNPKNQGGITSADWSTASKMPAIEILDSLQTFVYQICLEKQIEFPEQYSEYFSQVRNDILEKIEGKKSTVIPSDTQFHDNGVKPIILSTEIKIGITNFTTKNGIRLPRDPTHLFLFVKTLLGLNLKSSNYRDALGLIRGEIVGIKPAQSDLRIMRQIGLCYNQQPEEIISEKILRSTSEEIISNLHKYIIGTLIPTWHEPIDAGKVNEYFHSIGSTYSGQGISSN